MRRAKGVSLSQLAELTGLHRMALARVERTGTDAKASTLSAIAKALDVPVCDLFESSGHERRAKPPKR